MPAVSVTCVALLRGINVGKAKRIAMADLRKAIAALGYGDVRTLLNSGNVMFEAPKAEGAAPRIEQAIASKLGVTCRVTVLPAREVAAALAENPLAAHADQPSRLLLTVPRAPGALARLAPLTKERWAPEALAVGKRAAYLWCANGISAGRLWIAVDKALGEDGTTRNLATLTKLLALAEGA